MFATSAFSCRQRKGGNANGTISAQTTVNLNQNTGNNNAGLNGQPVIVGSGKSVGMSKDGYKSVDIQISDDPANPGKCVIADPGPVTLSKKHKDKIRWCVTNNCQAAGSGTVTIYDFSMIGNPGKKNPFGSGAANDNTFDIAPSDYQCKVKTKEATAGADETRYKYSISIKDGGGEKGMLDPVIIISNLDSIGDPIH